MRSCSIFFLSLAYFLQLNVLQVHPWSHKWQDLLLSWGWTPYSLYPSSLDRYTLILALVNNAKMSNRGFLPSLLSGHWLPIAKWGSQPHPHQSRWPARDLVTEAHFCCFRWKSGKRALDSFACIYFWPDQRSCRQPVLMSWFLFFLAKFFFFWMVFTPHKPVRGSQGVNELERVRENESQRERERESEQVSQNGQDLDTSWCTKYTDLHRSQWPEISHSSPWCE